MSPRQQVEQWVSRAQELPSAKAVGDATEAVKGELGQIEDRLIQSAHQGARDQLDLPVPLNRKLLELTAVVANAACPPTHQMYQVFDCLSADTDQQLVTLQQVVDEGVAQFANLVRDLDIPAIAT